MNTIKYELLGLLHDCGAHPLYGLLRLFRLESAGCWLKELTDPDPGNRIPYFEMFHESALRILEFITVSLLLGVVWALSPGGMVEILGSVAVAANFGFTQAATDLAEDGERKTRRFYVLYYTKEAFWLLYFVLLGAWSGLAAVVLFTIYPLWRKWWHLQYNRYYRHRELTEMRRSLQGHRRDGTSTELTYQAYHPEDYPVRKKRN